MQIIAVIAAHNEAKVLGQSLTSLCSSSPPPGHILVIADHCTDATATVACQAGAVVFERSEGEGGKGNALSWLFHLNPPQVATCPIVIVLDADSTVNAGFFELVRQAFADGAQAAQAFVQPVSAEASPASALAAYSEMLSQLADDALRQKLGWQVPLRGTGMAFRTNLLRDLLPQVRTRTEDIELSLLLAERGSKVVHVPRAIVYDPKPPSAALVSRQRARWLQGQVEVWRCHWRTVIRLLRRGPATWWLLQALLIKPKTLFLVAKAVLCAVGLLALREPAIQAILAALVLADILYFLLGLWLVPPMDRRLYLTALLKAPVYLWVWGTSLITAVRTRGGWLSVRH